MTENHLKTEAKDILLQLLNHINQLTIDEYTEKINLLGNSSIGEHCRHIIELFQELLLGYESGVVNYDNRKRDIRIQNNIDFASECIAHVVSSICKDNKTLKISTLYNNQESSIESNFDRELLYNIEHCIHHQAIIKIGMMSMNIMAVNEGFGVAKSTQIFREQKAN